ncbi:uncharacterized protein LOC117724731 [Arvicanthis niloticus]|uniref:uncharacterized protein LOC117724731 n=2 Tax=Arvicanthis niloticus TaxID=61156 RepID=UPI001486408D|nr:uncharacterized protein LOC117724731 [Arvicanthis niloticus]
MVGSMEAGSNVGGSSVARKSQRSRVVWQASQKEALLSAFSKSPYVSFAQRQNLASQMGVPDSCIRVWFQNRRSRTGAVGQELGSRAQGGGMPSDHRRPRTRITSAQRRILLQAFERNPRPGFATREELAQRTGLLEDTVYIWFQNRRARCLSRGRPTAQDQDLLASSGADEARGGAGAREHEGARDSLLPLAAAGLTDSSSPSDLPTFCTESQLCQSEEPCGPVQEEAPAQARNTGPLELFLPQWLDQAQAEELVPAPLDLDGVLDGRELEGAHDSLLPLPPTGGVAMDPSSPSDLPTFCTESQPSQVEEPSGPGQAQAPTQASNTNPLEFFLDQLLTEVQVEEHGSAPLDLEPIDTVQRRGRCGAWKPDPEGKVLVLAVAQGACGVGGASGAEAETMVGSMEAGSNVGGSSVARKSQRSRVVWQASQKEALLSAFSKSPYVSFAQRQNLASQMGVPDSCIRVWFQNRRSRTGAVGQELGSRAQGGGMPSDHRRPRTRITSAQRRILLQAFERNPRPGFATREELAQRTGLLEDTVYIWFQNRRARCLSRGRPTAQDQDLLASSGADEARGGAGAREHEGARDSLLPLAAAGLTDSSSPSDLPTFCTESQLCQSEEPCGPVQEEAPAQARNTGPLELFLPQWLDQAQAEELVPAPLDLDGVLDGRELEGAHDSLLPLPPTGGVAMDPSSPSDLPTFCTESQPSQVEEPSGPGQAQAPTQASNTNPLEFFLDQLLTEVQVEEHGSAPLDLEPIDTVAELSLSQEDYQALLDML